MRTLSASHGRCSSRIIRREQRSQRLEQRRPRLSLKNRPRRNFHLKSFSVTHHTVTINGKAFAYSATAGTMQIRRDASDNGWKGLPLLLTAYTADKRENEPERPVTFAFKWRSRCCVPLAPPGGHSVPSGVLLTDEKGALPPPYRAGDQ